MLSTLAIISIFAEIFAEGVLFLGAAAFLNKYLIQKLKKDLILSLIFVSLAIYIGLTLASQLFFNLDKPVSLLIMLQKSIAIDLLACSLLVYLFIKHKFKNNLILPFIAAYFFAIIYFCYRIIVSSVNLVYRPEVIEPVVSFSLPTPAYQLWVASFFTLFLFSLFYFIRQKGALKTLSFYNAVSALFISSSYLGIFFYITTQNNYFLLLSWLLVLLGVICLTLAEIIPPEGSLARNPLNFFRSRILFKLIFIFVLLIVILFEVTTLATLILSKTALRSYVFSGYKEAALGLAQSIENQNSFDAKTLENLVKNRKIGRSAIAYIVNSKGVLVAHPDMARVSLNLNLRNLEPVRRALQGMSGAQKFPPDEFGEIKVGAYAPIKKFGGAVVVEEPLSSAFYEMRQLETNSLLFVLAGIILTVLTGLLLAKSIEDPIHKLTLGTEAISKGNLAAKINIDSIDEIGSLAQAFNKMTHDLRDSQDRLILSEKLASLGTMAAGMAHEIKNPLVSLRTFSQLLQQKWEDKEFRDKFSQIVPTEIERINKIAESLLKFGRPTKAEISRVDINSVLEEILTLFESECRKNGIQVSKNFAELPEITGDLQQLSQAFVNIILNAIQAMEKGGELIVKTDIGEIIYKDKKDSPEKVIFIEVTDTGPGIPLENIKSLFDPFFTTKAKGTGMGLPITLRIIEEHKGSIKVKSEVGKGTTFIISLPQKME